MHHPRRRRVETAFQRFRDTVAAALAVVESEHAAAAAARDRCQFELAVMRAGIERARHDPELARQAEDPARRSVLAGAEAHAGSILAEWMATGPTELAGLVGSAGAPSSWRPWQEWLGQDGPQRHPDSGRTGAQGDAPALWRVGEVAPHGFPAAVPMLDGAHLYLTAGGALRGPAERLVQYLLLRVISAFPPGQVQVHVWDTAQLSGALPGLRPLARAGLLTAHDPARLGSLLATLSDDIRRVHDRILVGGYSTATDYARATGNGREPWQIAVLLGNGEPLESAEERALQRIARNGLAVGVQLVLVDIPLVVNSAVESLELRDAITARGSMTGPDLVVRLDGPPPADRVTAACAAIADAAIAKRGRPPEFADLLPERLGGESSARGLATVIGRHDGRDVMLTIGDATPHVLVGGPSGSGKTNFLYALLGGLAARYAPAELELYLMDFKEGVSFAPFTPGHKDPSWLPHARLVGINVNADREFGLALLEFLGEELKRRAAAAKRHEVSKLDELREADPEGHWPRLLAVIDEFQCLFAERDAVTARATALLEDIARRGRSQGIHLVLASQDVAGIEAFWGKPAVFEQFTLRVALPKARRVLAEHNRAALEMPRWHAVVNHDSGVPHGNQLARIPDATARGTFGPLQQRLCREWSDGPPPRLFDGSVRPVWRQSGAAGNLAEGNNRVVVGQRIALTAGPAMVGMGREPARNLAVLGTAWLESSSTLCAAALSAAADPAARFTVLAGTRQAADVAGQLAGALRDAGREVDEPAAGIGAVLASFAAELDGRPGDRHYLVAFALDAVQSALEVKDQATRRSPGDELRRILKYGPEHGRHVLGWWRGVSRLKAALGIGPADDIGGWVAFDVHGQELSALAAGQLIGWSPRPHRGLFFDRAVHTRPEVLIPFDMASVIPALREEDGAA